MYFISFCFWCAFIKYLPSKKYLYIYLGNFIFLGAGTFFYLLNSNGDISDFFLIFKSFYYLAFLGLIAGRSIFEKNDVLLFYRILSGFFLITYFIAKFVLGNPRPIVFIENNYELIFLIILIFSLSEKSAPVNKWDWLLLLVIVILSSSRSSMVALIFAYALSFRMSLNFKTLISVLFLAIFVIISIFIFIGRLSQGDGSINSIDRVQFLYVFLGEVQGWGIYEWFFGMPVITPLSRSSCRELMYYEALFSYSGDGSCYSVILHSFVLRTIYDHGLFGVLLVFFSIYFILTRCGYSLKGRLGVLMILIATGLSVSSVNSVFTAVGLLVSMTLKPDRKLIYS